MCKRVEDVHKPAFFGAVTQLLLELFAKKDVNEEVDAAVQRHEEVGGLRDLVDFDVENLQYVDYQREDIADEEDDDDDH